jgi:hypothetical protein
MLVFLRNFSRALRAKMLDIIAQCAQKLEQKSGA